MTRKVELSPEEREVIEQLADSDLPAAWVADAIREVAE